MHGVSLKTILALILLLAICPAHSVESVAVPDPYNLGQRLAAIAWLRERGVNVPAGSDESTILAMYDNQLRIISGSPTDLEITRTALRDAEELVENLRQQVYGVQQMLQLERDISIRLKSDLANEKTKTSQLEQVVTKQMKEISIVTKKSNGVYPVPITDIAPSPTPDSIPNVNTAVPDRNKRSPGFHGIASLSTPIAASPASTGEVMVDNFFENGIWYVVGGVVALVVCLFLKKSPLVIAAAPTRDGLDPTGGSALAPKEYGKSASIAIPDELLKNQQKTVSIGLGLGILLLPYVFSWFLLKGRYSVTAKSLSFGWLFILVMGVATSNGGGRNYNSDQTRQVAEASFAEKVMSIGANSGTPISREQAEQVESYANGAAAKYGINKNEVAAFYLTLRQNPKDPHSHMDAVLNLDAVIRGIINPGGGVPARRKN